MKGSTPFFQAFFPQCSLVPNKPTIVFIPLHRSKGHIRKLLADFLPDNVKTESNSMKQDEARRSMTWFLEKQSMREDDVTLCVGACTEAGVRASRVSG